MRLKRHFATLGLLSVLSLAACQTSTGNKCPPSQIVTQTEIKRVDPEPVAEAALQKPPAPILRPGLDAHVVGANAADLMAYDGELSAFADSLIAIIRCRINRQCTEVKDAE